MLRLYAVSGLRAACWLGLIAYLGAFLAVELGFDAGRVSLAYMAAGSGVLAGSLMAGRIRRG